MKLEQSFEVQAPLDQVWRALIDVERVAPCLPGAAVTGRNDDGSYNGTFSVKVGPTTASYSGKLEMRDVDEAAHRATMYANGSDKRGQGGAMATIVSTLAEIEPKRTRVEVSTDYRITGRLARFGRGGMIEDISQKMLRKFADCLQTSLADGSGPVAAPPAEPAPVGSDSAAGNGAGEGASLGTEPHQPRETHAAPDHAAPGAAAAEPPRPSPVQPTELSGLSLIGGVVLDRVRANPAPVLAAAAVLLLLARERRRRRG